MLVTISVTTIMLHRSYLDSAHQQPELQLYLMNNSHWSIIMHAESIGPDFILLAEEYHQVMAEIENKNGHYKNLPNLKKSIIIMIFMSLFFEI